jgi:hypothetical protein
MTVTAGPLDLSHANLRRLLEGADEVRWSRVAFLHCQPLPHDRWLYMCLELTRCGRRAGLEQVPAPARLHALVQRQAQVNRRNRYAWRW